MTFGLLVGGHSEYQASAEVGQRTDRIRRFITQLVRRYCVENDEDGDSFSNKVDQILKHAVAIGYHLVGVAEKYRWDWTWLAPRSKLMGLNRVGTPPPRHPAEEELEEGMWIIGPALVRETNDLGQQLAEEITVVEAKNCSLLNKYEVGDGKPRDNEAIEEELEKARAELYRYKYVPKAEREKAKAGI